MTNVAPVTGEECEESARTLSLKRPRREDLSPEEAVTLLAHQVAVRRRVQLALPGDEMSILGDERCHFLLFTSRQPNPSEGVGEGDAAACEELHPI